MPGKKISLYPPDWLKFAKKDWERMEWMLEHKDMEAAGYFLHQSLEKSLKAFLLQKGWKLKRIHELGALLDEAVKYEPELKAYRSLCERVAEYHLLVSYPLPANQALTIVDIGKDRQDAKKFILDLLKELSE